MFLYICYTCAINTCGGKVHITYFMRNGTVLHVYTWNFVQEEKQKKMNMHVSRSVYVCKTLYQIYKK